MKRSIDQEQKQLKQDQEAIEQEKQTLAQQMQQNPIVKLDIGGTLHKTLLSTLTKHPGFFQDMFSSTQALLKDGEGAIFIDRDGRYFYHVLNYLRDGRVPQTLTTSEVEALVREAEFYKLSNLLTLLEQIATKSK